MDKTNTYINDDGETVIESTSHKAIVFNDKKLLLIRNEHTGELCIPGGREKVGEEYGDTLIRELIEEARLKCRLISAELIQSTPSIFRWKGDGILRHINKKWYVCEVEVDAEEATDACVWADYQTASDAFQRQEDLLLLEKIRHYF